MRILFFIFLIPAFVLGQTAPSKCDPVYDAINILLSERDSILLYQNSYSSSLKAYQEFLLKDSALSRKDIKIINTEIKKDELWKWDKTCIITTVTLLDSAENRKILSSNIHVEPWNRKVIYHFTKPILLPENRFIIMENSLIGGIGGGGAIYLYQRTDKGLKMIKSVCDWDY